MRTYGLVNLVLLGLLVWAVVFSVISPFMERLLPSVWRCHYLAVTGDRCPFCGLTRDMRSFMAGRDVLPECSLFPAFIRMFLAEVPLRALFTLAAFRTGWKHLPFADLVLHLSGLALYLLFLAP